MTRFLVPVLLGLVRLGSAEPLVVAGYQEAIFSVASIEYYEEFLGDVAGWQPIAAGDVPAAQLAAWGLDAGTHATYSLVGNPGTERGFVRLVQFAGIEQRQIRSNAQSWDTGGWFDVNTRVPDMAAKLESLQTRGWQASSDPVRFDFGPFTVIEWLARGPDGIVIAMIERVKPPLTGWDSMGAMSRLFNATQIVADLAAARAFYEGVLGFTPYLEHSGASPAEGPNVLGIPHNLADDIVRNVVIVHPHGTNEGSVELLEFDGLTGTDFSEHAVAPNLGILLLRFPVTSINALARRLHEANVTIVAPRFERELAPYGRVAMLTVQGPDGAWLEFFEPLGTGESDE